MDIYKEINSEIRMAKLKLGDDFGDEELMDKAIFMAGYEYALSKLSSMTPEEKIAHVIKLMNTDVRDCPQYPRRREMCTEDCETCLARQIMSLCYNPDKVREILIRHFEPVDVDDKVDFAYSLTNAVKEICEV